MVDLTTIKQWLTDVKLPFAERDGVLEAELPLVQEKLRVDIEGQWLRLQLAAPAALKLEADPSTPLSLLRQNAELRLAKFALDDRDGIVVCAQLPLESLDYSELVSAIERIRGAQKWFMVGMPQ